MPCDEQGVWIGPRSDDSDNVGDTAVALKRFEDELAEFERLGEEKWAAGDNQALVQVSEPNLNNIKELQVLIHPHSRAKRLSPVAQKQEPPKQRGVLSGVPEQRKQDQIGCGYIFTGRRVCV